MKLRVLASVLAVLLPPFLLADDSAVKAPDLPDFTKAPYELEGDVASGSYIFPDEKAAVCGVRVYVDDANPNTRNNAVGIFLQAGKNGGCSDATAFYAEWASRKDRKVRGYEPKDGKWIFKGEKAF